MQAVAFKAGDTIISEGEEGNTAFFIVTGSVEVCIGQGAKARTVGTLKTGEVFGEMCLIEPGPRSATVKAATDVECLADLLRGVHRRDRGLPGARGRVHEDAGAAAPPDERSDGERGPRQARASPEDSRLAEVGGAVRSRPRRVRPFLDDAVVIPRTALR